MTQLTKPLDTRAVLLTGRVLLDEYTPAAVVVDAAGLVVHVHGRTGRYLSLPPGGATLDVLALAADAVRGAVRTALHRAAEAQARVAVRDGLIDTPDGPRRVEVTAAPLDRRADNPLYLVTFADHPVPPPPEAAGDSPADRRLADELARTRDELQSALEELQTSNEEARASHEEVTSTNEELQSTNEELETSKEELQSLNEELTTVNAQLQAKMAELEAAGNDLQSLLTSTDIAVLFLDPEFRIRRYTPAVKELLDLIPGDVGRPLADLRWKFADSDLMADARAVLDRLVPVEREVDGGGGRAYLRRALPYRTQDNRIDGVVVAFVDVTERRRADEAVRASERRLRRMVNVPRVGVLTFDYAGTALHANDAFLDMVGYDRPAFEAGPRTWREFTPPEYTAASEAIVPQLRATGRGGPYEKEYLRRDGSRAWLMSVAADLGDGTFVEYALDTSDRKRAEDALRASEERLRAVAANLPNAASFVVGPDLRYELAAGQALETAGFAPADLEGRTLAEVLPADLLAVYEADYRRVLAGESFRREHTAHGRHYATHGAPLRDAGGAVTAALAVSYDITDRVRAEAARRETEQRHRLLVESVRDHALFGMDPAGVVTSWNEAAERLFGYIAAEAVGQSADHFFTPEDREAGLPERERATAATDGRAQDDNWLVRKDGRRFWASGSSSAVQDATGTLTGFVKVVRDRTEARAAAEAVRRAEEQLRLALQAARMGIWRWDIAADAHHREANLNRLLGLPAEPSTAPVGKFYGHIHPDDRAAVAAAFDRTARHGQSLSTEFRVVWPDGTTHWLRDQGDVFGTGGERYLTGVALDVTPLKEAEAALRAARDELEGRVAERTAELHAAVADLEAEAARRVAAEAARQDLLGRLAAAQEGERTRIARELHDSLGQYLTGMALGLANLRNRLPADRPERADLQRLTELSADMSREAHRLATELRPTALDDAGLEAAVQTYVEQWGDRTGVPAQFGGRGFEAGRVPEPAASAAYRAVQECLTNVARHAEATRVSVLLDRKPTTLEVIVEDDGRGFDPAAPAADARRRLGLLGMTERVALAGGDIEVESAPGAGTTVFIRLPLATGAP